MVAIESKQNKYLLIFMIVMFITLTSCAGPQIYNSDMQVTNDPLMTQKLVGTAIMSASRFYEEWTITKVRSGEMKGTLNYGAHTAIVSIPYNATSFQIIHQNSSNFNYEAEDQTIHGRYNAWVKTLENRINEEVNYHLQLQDEN
jgi:hypothetical protein